MIDLASVEAQTTTPQLEWVAAADIIEAARRQAESLLQTHPVRIVGQVDQSLVRLDPRLTSSALAHVIENAARYSPSASPIEIAVTVGPDRLALAVRDRGPGVPAHELTRIFERFYRGSGARQDTFGSGMGLAIARGLLEQQGGRISAANDPAGGAVFTLEVPTTTRPIADVTFDVA